MTTMAKASLLTDRLLAGFAARARRYDEQNSFFTDDFRELREAGYLRLAVPDELGGFGLSLAEVVREQRRLAYHAAPTALAINMHLYWTGRRIRDLPARRAGTAVSRRAPRQDSPGEFDADPRDRGEDAPRNQPGRNAAVGLTQSRLV